MKKISQALISVSDKRNLKKILSVLKKFKIKIISSGGTFKEIKKNGYKCNEVSNFTKFPEILDGRVKTLHPKIHAGILNERNKKSHKLTMKSYNFENIDLVIVNFYPFEKAFSESTNHNKIIENSITLLDIKGNYIKFYKSYLSELKTLKRSDKGLLSVIVGTCILSNFDNSDEPIIHIRFQMTDYSYDMLLNLSDWVLDNFKLKGIQDIGGIDIDPNSRLIEYDKNKKRIRQ